MKFPNMLGRQYVFTVTGSGTFPVELLASEECFPRSSEDAALIFNKNILSRSITLASFGKPKCAVWLTRGWMVKGQFNNSNVMAEQEDYVRYHTWPC